MQSRPGRDRLSPILPLQSGDCNQKKARAPPKAPEPCSRYSPIVPKHSKSSNRGKQLSSATKKLISESQKQARKDLADQWRFLKKIGAYNSKESVAQIRLTDSRIRAIKKKMHEIQKSGKYLKGRVIHPAVLETYTTKSGKVKTRYALHPAFVAVRSKNKPKIENGVTRLGKDRYIIESTGYGAKIRINKNGDVVEVRGKTRRIRTRYKGKDLLKFAIDLDEGRIKIPKGQYMELYKWGSGNAKFPIYYDAPSALLGYLKELMEEMPPELADRFIRASFVEKVRGTWDD